MKHNPNIIMEGKPKRNNPAYSSIDTMLKKLKSGQAIAFEVTSISLNARFNNYRYKDSGMLAITVEDQFEEWCRGNGLAYTYSLTNNSYTIKLNRNDMASEYHRWNKGGRIRIQSKGQA